MSALVFSTVSASAAVEGNLSYTVSNGKATITSCQKTVSGALTIPSKLGGYPVTSIADEAYRDCTNLTSITIPNSVTSIGNLAFSNTGYYNNSSNWENGVLYIGNHLIDAKTTISGNYTIKSGTKTIANWAFFNCDSLTSIVIPNSVTSIGSSAFRDCTNLKNVYYTGSETQWNSIRIGSNNSYLTNATIYYNYDENNDTQSLFEYTVENGKATITGCNESISGELVVPSTLGGYPVTSIGDQAFYWCYSLTSVVIPEGVTSIGDEAFYWCESLTSVTIPSSVTSIGNYAFQLVGGSFDSSTAKTVSVYITDIAAWCNINFEDYYSNPLWYGGNLYLNNELVKDLIIPEGVTSIGDYTFKY